jgi:Tol biopolymer transport system component
MSFYLATSSIDGKEVFAVGGQARGQLTRYDKKTATLVPFLGGISAEHLNFSKDGQWVAYVSFPEHIVWRSRIDGSEKLQLTTSSLWASTPRWSPDGEQIAFSAIPGAESFFKSYVVSADGGKPDLIGEGPTHMIDTTWAADGKFIVFGESGFAPHGRLWSFDLQTRQVAAVPGSEGKYSPRISPDGHFMVAIGSGNVTPPGKMFLYDMQKEEWSELLNEQTIGGGWPHWSSDNKYVYFIAGPPRREIHQYRVRISDRKLEQTAFFEVPEGTTGWAEWVGTTPDGSPLVLRDLSFWEVYALDVEFP